MSRYRMMMALAGAAAVCCAAPLTVTRAAQVGAEGSAWGEAIAIPGLGALNAGGHIRLGSVSCASEGNCAVGGSYFDRSERNQAFVASQRNGHWGRAIEVPGTRALNARGSAAVVSVSCPSAGNCAAGGYYRDGSGHFQAFVASQRNGRWGTAIRVPGTGALNAGGDAHLTSMSCASAGNCTAGGSYRDGSKHAQAFVASQRNGRWRTAIEVPGTGALNTSGFAKVLSVSCASAGNCTAGGFYRDASKSFQAFVASQRNGRWGTAIEVPGTATLNVGGTGGANAQVLSVSCASAGNCTAGGFYLDSSPNIQAFVASQRNGHWGTAIEVPGTGALNARGWAEVASVSCPSAGNCTVGGFTDGVFFHAFVASQRNGHWGTAIWLPGTTILKPGGSAQVLSVSCASAGNCAAGGFRNDLAFLASQQNGHWSTAIKVPGLRALDGGRGSQLTSVSCNRPGPCTATGFYLDRSGNLQGFVVSRS